MSISGNSERWDVIVTGAGPAGLMLACEARLHGVSVAVLERLPEPDTTIKSLAINAVTVEAFRRRGLYPELRRAWDRMLVRMAPLRRLPGEPEPDLDTMRRRTRHLGGHFAGISTLDPSRVDRTDPDFAGAERTLMLIPQAEIERILLARARELGVRLIRAATVCGVDADERGITVRLTDGDTLSGAYLAGCDGGRSTVRKLAGIAFPGTDPTMTACNAEVTLDRPGLLNRGWTRTSGGMLLYGPQPGRVVTVEFDAAPADRDAPVTAAELEASLRRITGSNVAVLQVHSATRFTDNARLAETYRTGRILLAGDAAHVHSPFGGQGLNLGIGDAMNLGWKLAAVVRGANEALLDTYTAERRPVADRILEITRAQIALMRPDPGTTALRRVVAQLIETGDGNAYFVKMAAGIEHRYDLGDDHPAVGRPAPLIDLGDGTSLADHCADGGFVLLDTTDVGAAAALMSANPRIRVVTTTADRACALLVRPDGCVAWARDDGATIGLAAAVERWCPAA
ncbi:FAD-dependent monooxygenase [Nocardia nova]|uniref:FAD-dependent monooxygenase n=1 Tax=Nocardia nova TaxID=37330 RepID=UPI0033F3ED95